MPWFTKQRKKKARNTTKHKTKKRQQIFRIKLRNDRFRMFGPHSKLISAVSAWFKADFGHFGRQPIRPNSANTAWLWLNLPGSVWIEAESARIEPSRCESMKKKKKKKLRHGTDEQAATLDAAPYVGPRRTLVWHPPSRIRAS